MAASSARANSPGQSGRVWTAVRASPDTASGDRSLGVTTLALPLPGKRAVAETAERISSALVSEIASRIMARFRWVHGHADVWLLFTEPLLFRDVVRALAEPFRDSRITKVAGVEARGFVVEARGFVVGGAVATELAAGFVAIRKEAGLFPGEKLTRATSADYRGNRTLLRLQRAAVTPADRVLIVDDWFETGSQALAAKALIEEAGATFVGASVIVDQLPAEVRLELHTFAALVHSDALGSSL